MALNHCFKILNNNEVIEKVDVPDDIINYIKDSFLWIESKWNKKSIKRGLPYYGNSLIEHDEVSHMKKIFEQWRKLFDLGSDIMVLTGNFLVDDMKYEKIKISKGSLLVLFDKLIKLFEDAEKNGLPIYYEGI